MDNNTMAFAACAFGAAPSNQPQQSSKPPCNPTTRIAGVVKAADGLQNVMIMGNLAVLHFFGAVGLPLVGCATPEPGEPAVCGASIFGGVALAGGGVVLSKGAYSEAKEELIPGVEQAITCKQ